MQSLRSLSSSLCAIGSLPLRTARVGVPSNLVRRGVIARFSASKPADLGVTRRKGDQYILTEEEKARYHRDGFIVLPGVLSEEELAPIERVVDEFIAGKHKVPGKDFCDMSKGLDAKPEEFSLVNAMLPRRYYPPFAGNLFERRCASISQQLYGNDMALDFDQILAKKPGKSDAQFAWHQDAAYWPITKDMRTATISLALDPAFVENGCIRFVVGSHREKELRRHYPMAVNNPKKAPAPKDGDKEVREEVHALVTHIDDAKDTLAYAPVPRGGVSVHDERIVHGSGGNTSSIWRRTYIVVHRAASTVEWERAHGFTHSHNDNFNWDKFHDWAAPAKGKAKQTQ